VTRAQASGVDPFTIEMNALRMISVVIGSAVIAPPLA